MPRGIKQETMEIFKAKVKEAVMNNRFSFAEFIAGEAEIPENLKTLMHGKSKVWELFLQENATETHKITSSQSIHVKNYEGYVKSIGKFINSDEFKGNF